MLARLSGLNERGEGREEGRKDGWKEALKVKSLEDLASKI